VDYFQFSLRVETKTVMRRTRNFSRLLLVDGYDWGRGLGIGKRRLIHRVKRGQVSNLDIKSYIKDDYI